MTGGQLPWVPAHWQQQRHRRQPSSREPPPATGRSRDQHLHNVADRQDVHVNSNHVRPMSSYSTLISTSCIRVPTYYTVQIFRYPGQVSHRNSAKWYAPRRWHFDGAATWPMLVKQRRWQLRCRLVTSDDHSATMTSTCMFNSYQCSVLTTAPK